MRDKSNISKVSAQMSPGVKKPRTVRCYDAIQEMAQDRMGDQTIFNIWQTSAIE